MNNMIEIRWHGRGGQGAKTASQLLADAAFMSGKYIQSFPEYGPERVHRLQLITVFLMRDARFIPIFTNRIMSLLWMKHY